MGHEEARIERELDYEQARSEARPRRVEGSR